MATLRWPDALVPFVRLATLVLIVAILSLGQAIIIPVALAGFLAFVLMPPVRALERIGTGRAFAVAFSMTLALGAIAGFGYLVSRQVGELAANMPAYSDAIRVKFAALRATNLSLASIQQAVEKVSADIDRDRAKEEARKAAIAPPRAVATAHAQPVTVVETEPTDIERLRGIVVPVFEPIATGIIVLILTAFLLVQREDVRNRFIRLMGQGRITVTTRTIDEAGHRISRFLLTQTVINAAFGMVVTAGLFVIGVPYAVLWGACAGVLRFVPYIGALLSLLMPTALAFVQFEGWGPTFATLGLFLTADLITAQMVEPLVVGQRTGVSALALLIMALLWTWLWGPIGLLLSTPITVCLAALGKHIPQLEFLEIALGDAPPLPAPVTYYQRLLARDDDEAHDIVEHELAEKTFEQVVDEILIPALLLASSDRARDEITDTEQRFILDSTRSIAEEAAEQAPLPEAPELVDGRAAPLAGCRVVLLPGRGEADALLVDLLARSLGTDNALPPGASKMLVSELVTAMADSPPDMAFICALPPGGLNYARYLCKRLRAVVPSARLVLVRPHGELADESAVKRLQGLEVDAVVGSLTEAAAEARRLLAIEVGAAPRASSVEDSASALDVSPPLEPAETA